MVFFGTKVSGVIMPTLTLEEVAADVAVLQREMAERKRNELLISPELVKNWLAPMMAILVETRDDVRGLKIDVAVLKVDVATLKTDVKALKENMATKDDLAVMEERLVAALAPKS